jgi:sugar O-acyltransferase (sialic acid O-acetyltransferase NeuD family)
MKKIIIVGAGGFGRELLQWIKDINYIKPTWIIEGFIDDNLDALNNLTCDFNVIGKISDWQVKNNEVFALAIAEPHIKEQVVSAMISKGAVFESIIHPQAKICDFSTIGQGAILYPHSTIGPNCLIGDFVTILSSGIGHDSVIDDYVTISSCCDICGHTHIEKNAFLASHVVLPPSCKIGHDAYVGAGSVVIRNVPPNKKVFGNPAKVISV